MTTKVEKSVVVDVPVSVAYGQWTQFEEFPHFMGGVTEVRQLTDDRLHWVAEIAGVKREWEAKILEQVPDQKVAWAATEGATNAGAVQFEPAGPGSTHVHLTLEYEPEGLVEKVGDALSIVEKQAEGDLERFKAFIEERGTATGTWRGEVPGAAGSPTVDDAAASRGDSGKAGVSGKAVAAGAAVAGAAVAAAVAARSGSDQDRSEAADAASIAVPPPPPGTTGTTAGAAPVGTTATDELGTPVVDADDIPPGDLTRP
ncbi:SRPBCC family protein [Actinotalea sp. AC32]|nr:SRPBCC family protein [Actinotalea sp. AC32]